MTQSEPVARRAWLSLGALCGAAGLVWLAFADLAVAIPDLAKALDASVTDLQWANNLFSLATGACVIATGRLADLYGSRRVLQIGLIIFMVGSVVAAFATGVLLLMAGRVVMGIGAAAILPATLALIPLQFSGRPELTAFGVWQAVAWGGQAVAPAIGGVITEGVGWAWLFWINLPLGILVMILVKVTTPESQRSQSKVPIDWAGMFLIAGAVFALMYALTVGPAAGWGQPQTWLPLVASAILAAGWIAWEKRVAHPLVDLSLFKIRSYDGAIISNTAINAAFAGMSFVTVLWLQNGKGMTPIGAGLMVLPATLGILLLIPVGARLEVRYGTRRPTMIGLLVLALGCAAMAGVVTDAWVVFFVVALLVIGIGIGMLATPVSDIAVGEVPARLSGSSAGVFKMSSMVGGSLGVAILSAVVRPTTASSLNQHLVSAGLSDSSATEAVAALRDSGNLAHTMAAFPDAVQQAIKQAVGPALGFGVAATMLVAAVLVLISAGLVSVIWKRPKDGSAKD